ncbi:hypothetical protein M0804_010516 [Polistes exclamans]|nr:hypothetical protein M0804_010516 [Polistes exclamans]
MMGNEWKNSNYSDNVFENDQRKKEDLGYFAARLGGKKKEKRKKKMVWEDLLSVKELTEMKKKTPRFPSRERNFAMRRRGPRRSASLMLPNASPIGAPPIEKESVYTYEEPCNDNLSIL